MSDGSDNRYVTFQQRSTIGFPLLFVHANSASVDPSVSKEPSIISFTWKENQRKRLRDNKCQKTHKELNAFALSLVMWQLLMLPVFTLHVLSLTHSLIENVVSKSIIAFLSPSTPKVSWFYGPTRIF